MTSHETIAQTEKDAAIVTVSVPVELSERAAMSKRAFDAVCASCHGDNAGGQQGIAPPLIHKIYEPSHHGDMSFVLAAQRGVESHHWPFGDMPSVDYLTKANIVGIVAYVRELQLENGIN